MFDVHFLILSGHVLMFASCVVYTYFLISNVCVAVDKLVITETSNTWFIQLVIIFINRY